MARDLKLSNWTWTTVAGGANTMAVTASTPSGDPTNTQGLVTLANGAAAGAGVGSFRASSDAKNVAGFINSKLDNSSFANFLAGQEVSSVNNQPALWGNTSYMNMYARCAVSLGGIVTGATVTFPQAAGAYIVMEGAYDNGASTPAPSGLWLPISGAIPLVSGVAALSTTALVTVTSAHLFTTTTLHGLSVGDHVVLSAVGGLAGVNADQVYQVFTTPTQTTFTLSNVSATPAILTITGTSTGCVVQKLITNNTQTKIVSAPMTQSLRPWLRWSVHYFSLTNTNVANVTLSKTSLVLGRDNAMVG